MTFKIGDYVRILSIQELEEKIKAGSLRKSPLYNSWYIHPLNEHSPYFTEEMVKYCNTLQRIEEQITYPFIGIKFKDNIYSWQDWMFEPIISLMYIVERLEI